MRIKDMILCFACLISSNKVMGEQIFVRSGRRIHYSKYLLAHHFIRRYLTSKTQNCIFYSLNMLQCMLERLYVSDLSICLYLIW